CLTNRLMSQPFSAKSTASQSNSFGWEGRAPCIPKSSEVLTIPLPKNSCHILFTNTRAVSGFFESNIHSDKPSLFLGYSAENGNIDSGVPGNTSVLGAS